jgi:hypothetical protein
VASLTATGTVLGLEPGAYRLVAATVSQNGVSYRAAPDTLPLTVTASLVATPAVVNYGAQVGRLSVTVGGLPAGVNASLQLSAPGLQRTITSAGTLDSLPEGSYQLVAQAVLANGDRYGALPTTQTVQIRTGQLTAAGVQYTIIPTVVDFVISGLPSSIAASATGTGPDGETYAVTESRRIFPARPGHWRLTALPVSHATGT